MGELLELSDLLFPDIERFEIIPLQNVNFLSESLTVLNEAVLGLGLLF